VSAAVTPLSARAAVASAAARLGDAGVPTARVDAEWLLAGILGVGRAALAAQFDRELPPAVAARYDIAVERRARREPLQYILGWEEFCGLRFTLTPDVLIPRPETETLVEWALAFLPPVTEASRLAIDVGTGSGCLACALATTRRDLRVIALDAAPAAVSVARANVTALGLGDRVMVMESDLFAGLPPTHADLIVSNPPYLPTSIFAELAPEVTDQEPRLALDGGADGLDVIRRLVVEARARLAPGGRLVLETAGEVQVMQVVALMNAEGFVDVTTRRDLTGVVRFVAGRAAGTR